MLYVNIASSTSCLEGFVNFDNSIFLHFVKRAPFLTKFFPSKHSAIVNEYRNICSKFDIRIFDCRKRLPFPDGTIDHALCSHYLEHLYQADSNLFLENLFKTVRPSGSVHIIVPDLKLIIESYIAEASGCDNDKAAFAAENFNFRTILTYKQKPSFVFSFLEATGAFGLMHHFMFDKASLTAAVERVGFTVEDMPENCPSYDYRRHDDSLHLYCVKK